MFRAGLGEEHHESARLHASALRKVGDILNSDPQLAMDLFMALMYDDTDYAVKNLRHLLLDYEHYLNHYLEAYLRTAESALPDVGTSYRDVHASLQFPIARSSLKRLRRIVAITNTRLSMNEPPEAATAELFYVWAGVMTHLDSARLLERYIELKDLEPANDHERQGERYLEAAVSLTTLYHIRNTVQRAIVDERDLRDASQILIPQLKDVLLKAMPVLTTEQLCAYRLALFRMYFCGTHYEERFHSGLGLPSVEPTNGWFQQMFTITASQLGFTRWQDVKVALAGFMYTDLMPPDTAVWFDREIDSLIDGLWQDEEGHSSVIDRRPVWRIRDLRETPQCSSSRDTREVKPSVLYI